MDASLLDSYLITNKKAIQYAIKVSVSIWGSLVIGLLMNFEHPTWAMITGMISFFAPDQAQVAKKCLYQCISTLAGGIVAVFFMARLSQSPVMLAFMMAGIVFCGAAISYNSRDTNFTFCIGIFTVTIAIIIAVPVFLTPTIGNIVNVFIDRVGTILAGIVWTTFVSAALWPVFSADKLRASVRKLFKDVTAPATPTFGNLPALMERLNAVYSTVLVVQDLAANCEFEGPSGKRSAGVARAINLRALEIIFDLQALQAIRPSDENWYAGELKRLDDVMIATPENLEAIDGHLSPALDLLVAEWTDLENRIASAPHDPEDLDAVSKLKDAAIQLKAFTKLYVALTTSRRLNVEGIKIPHHLDLTNCLRTGLRSALYYLCAFTLWYGVGWGYGFLAAIVPVIFSITLAKVPHVEVVVWKVATGLLLGIPPGLFIFVLVAEAPSAVEIMMAVSAPILLIGLMGLTNMAKTFAYSLGFCISYMVLLFPLNSPDLDAGFAVERSLAMAIGTMILSFLFVLIPRKPMLTNPGNLGTLFAANLEGALLKGSGLRVTQHAFSKNVGLIIDKMIQVASNEAPDRKAELIDKGSQAIFLLAQLRDARIVANALSDNTSLVDADIAPWKAEVYANYIGNKNEITTSLPGRIGEFLPKDKVDDAALVSMLSRLTSIERGIRRVIGRNGIQAAS